MKFLLDENLPPSFSNLLRKEGIEARHVSEVGLESTEDDVIVSFVAKSGEIIITYDLDFSRIISAITSQSPSLITLRVTKLNSKIFLRIFNDVISSCRADLEIGAMITVEDDRIRVRKLPVVKKKKK
jgi:predicted nuclease of predicted toxin-antitoxin system